MPVVLALLSGFALFAFGGFRVREALRRRAILRRLGPAAGVRELDGRAGGRVVLEGVLLEGAVASRFEGVIRAIEEPHPRASTTSFPTQLRLQVGEALVAITDPVQVVLGAKELRSRAVGSRRLVRGGDRVLAVGHLVAVAGEQSPGYRVPAVRHELRPSAAGEHVALYAVSSGPGLRANVLLAAIGLASAVAAPIVHREPADAVHVTCTRSGGDTQTDALEP